MNKCSVVVVEQEHFFISIQTVFNGVHPMPRKDTTFKQEDIVRFFCRNIDRHEAEAVVCFFFTWLGPYLSELALGGFISPGDDPRARARTRARGYMIDNFRSSIRALIRDGERLSIRQAALMVNLFGRSGQKYVIQCLRESNVQ